jgi:hypothetical protein
MNLMYLMKPLIFIIIVFSGFSCVITMTSCKKGTQPSPAQIDSIKSVSQQLIYISYFQFSIQRNPIQTAFHKSRQLGL